MNAPIARLSYLLLAGVTGVGAFTAGEASGSENWKSLGISIGIGVVFVFVMRQVITYAVNKLIERWEAIPAEIQRVREEANKNFTSLEGSLDRLSTTISGLQRNMAVETGTYKEWRRGVERRLISVEQRIFGQVRARDLPEDLEVDLPEEKKE